MTSNWRDIGPTTLAAFEAEIRARAPRSPLLAEVEAIYEAVKPHSRLFLGMCWIEDRFQTDPSDDFPITNHNLMNMKTPDGSGWMEFDSYAAGAKGWIDRITSPTYKNGIYAKTETVAELVHVYAPAFDNNDEANYVRTIEAIVAELKVWEKELGMALRVDIALVNRGFPALTDNTPKVTVHNTGSGSNRSQEREFVKSGGGAQGVAYTFATDETGITQIMPLWKQGIHAGNVDGNRRSIAIEMCMLREPWSVIKENTAQLLAMLHTRDERLDWSGAEAFTFSLPETTEHRKWPGANPNCPQRLIATDGGYPVLVQRAWEIVGGATPNPIPEVQPHPVGGEETRKGKTFVDEFGSEWVWFFKRFEAKKTIQTYEYANVASRKGVPIKKGTGFYCYYLVAGQDAKEQPDMWGTTRRGWRFRLADVL